MSSSTGDRAGGGGGRSSTASAARATVVVVGGGIAGLAIAYELLERGQRSPAGLDVLCLEADARAGGLIQSARDSSGFLCEWAAHGFLDGAETTVTLVRRLALAERLVSADARSAARYVLRRGKLRRVPSGPRELLRSDLLSPLAKLRLAVEPLLPRRRSATDESVHAFVRRRLGTEAADVLADALVAGIYAGDVRRLSIAATFPRLLELERRNGSIVRGMLTRRAGDASGDGAAARGGPGRLASFMDGMQELTDALARALGPRLQLRAAVAALSALGRRGMRVHPVEGAPLDVDAVVLACPASAAAALLARLDGELSSRLGTLRTVPLAVVHLGYRRDQIGPLPDGIGFLVPRGQGRRVLGALWDSNALPGRAPAGGLLATVMLGGAHDPAVLELADGRLVDLAIAELRAVAGIAGRPGVTRVVRHARAIPQYELGHVAWLDEIDRRLADQPGLWLAGSSYRGVSVNDCIADAPRVAEAVLEYVNRRQHAAAP